MFLLHTLLPHSATAETHLATATATHHTFTVQGHDFLMDGKPYQVLSGELHYTRIPRPYWRDRLQKAKAMGLNTVTTYAFWNVHEPHPGQYDFEGQNDLAEFLREAQQAGLNVILRPGPYVCAEWELGGYPSWLLKDRSLKLRSDDPAYQKAVKLWFAKLGQVVRPLLLKNGGPIIAVQVENEYGAFGDDPKYLENVKQDLIATGMGDSLLYTANPPQFLTRGSLPELPTVINFGTGDAQKSFATLDRLRPDGPRMSGEYWAGWFDKWGEEHHQTDGQKEASEFQWMIDQGYSVSLYMFHGGTSFGWMNGADSHTGHDYHPDTTSYDYDAPLDEAGNPRYKFELFRQAISSHTHVKPVALPRSTPLHNYPIKAGFRTASLWRNLPTPRESKTPLSFEDLDQNYGYVLYRTDLDAGDGGKLVLDGLHDYAQIYIDQQLVGTLDRRLDQTTLDLPHVDHAATLDILVENTGRVNYSKAILTERKGLTGDVTLAGKPFSDWEIYSFPMEDLSQLHFNEESCSGPCFLQTSMQVTRPHDTFLDTKDLHKGQLWMNGHNLGRFWEIGPQFTLYAPGCWMLRGANTLTLFELQATGDDKLNTTVRPIYGATKSTRELQ
ncbi:MAG: beta-galactosidase [Acidobacteriaceae bacterium]|nr:beta-galactosidase [Acidobacteriaceae bacterium]